MNESDFENELRRLRPAAPLPRMEQAIARELTEAATVQKLHGHPRSGTIVRTKESPLARLLSGLGWACGGAAVAVIATISLYPFPTPQPVTYAPDVVESEDVLFEPSESSSELLATAESGVIYTDEEEPTRILRYNSLERYVWANPSTGARVEVEMPREDVVLLPVSFQ
jgi:hypothetical protein